MPAQWRSEFCLCLCIKELDLLEVGSCDDGAVGGKCHAFDPLLDGQGRLALASRHLPDLDGFVVASTYNCFAIWAPCDRIDTAFAMR